MRKQLYIWVLILAGVLIPSMVKAQGFPSNRVSQAVVSAPNAPTLSIGGSPGSITRSYAIVCHYDDGSVTGPSKFASISTAPNTLSAGNYVLIAGWPTNCTSIDVLSTSVHKAIAVGVTGTSFKDTGLADFTYSPLNQPDTGTITLQGPFIFNKAIAYPPIITSVAKNTTIDMSLGVNFVVNLSANATITLGNVYHGQTFHIDIVEASPGSFTPTFVAPTGYTLNWSASASQPSITTTAGTHNLFEFVVENTSIVGGLL